MNELKQDEDRSSPEEGPPYQSRKRRSHELASEQRKHQEVATEYRWGCPLTDYGPNWHHFLHRQSKRNPSPLQEVENMEPIAWIWAWNYSCFSFLPGELGMSSTDALFGDSVGIGRRYSHNPEAGSIKSHSS